MLNEKLVLRKPSIMLNYIAMKEFMTMFLAFLSFLTIVLFVCLFVFVFGFYPVLAHWTMKK